MPRQSAAVIGFAALALSAALSACGGSGGNIVGNWKASDGSGTKVITADGACTGMYYYKGRPLDIGGPMSCSFSEKAGSDGSHTMVVQQPPNSTTLHLRFIDADTVEVSSKGSTLFTMTRL